MKCSPVDDGTPWDAPTDKRYRVLSHRTPEGNLTMVRDKEQAIAKQLIDHRVIRIAQARRGLDQRIKHPLQIEGRPANDLQYIRGSGLLIEGFAQLI